VRVAPRGWTLVPMEELSLGPERPPRRWPWVVLACVVVVGAVFSVLDARARDREVAELLSAVEAGEAAVTYAERRVAAMVTYASPALWSSGTPSRARQDLEQVVQEAAGAGADRVRELASEVDGADVLPWHGGVAAARDSYATHLRQRAAYLGRVAEDVLVLYEGDTSVGSSRARVHEAFSDAVGAEGRERIRALLPLG
jgi:hypothetical protein